MVTSSKGRRKHHFRLVTGDGVLKVGKKQRFLCRVTSTGVMTIFCEGRKEAERSGMMVPSLRRSSHLVAKSNWNCDQPFQGSIEQLSIYNSLLEWGDAFPDWNAFVHRDEARLLALQRVLVEAYVYDCLQAFG